MRAQGTNHGEIPGRFLLLERKTREEEGEADVWVRERARGVGRGRASALGELGRACAGGCWLAGGSGGATQGGAGLSVRER